MVNKRGPGCYVVVLPPRSEYRSRALCMVRPLPWTAHLERRRNGLQRLDPSGMALLPLTACGTLVVSRPWGPWDSLSHTQRQDFSQASSQAQGSSPSCVRLQRPHGPTGGCSLVYWRSFMGSGGGFRPGCWAFCLGAYTKCSVLTQSLCSMNG